MGTQITALPLSERSAFQLAQEQRRRNETAYETTVAVHELPSAHVAWEAAPDAVHVFATDMNVLAAWLYALGGTVVKTPLACGQTVWTLTSRTWSDSPLFPPVPVYVTVTQVAGEPVMHEIRAAVKAEPRCPRCQGTFETCRCTGVTR